MQTFAQQRNTLQKPVFHGAGHDVHPARRVYRSLGRQTEPQSPKTISEDRAAASAGKAHRFDYSIARMPVHSPVSPNIQTKLSETALGDIYEQEADRLSEQVMTTPLPQIQPGFYDRGGDYAVNRRNHPGEGGNRLQTKSIHAGEAGRAAAPPIVCEALAESGQSLDLTTRRMMESRFGHDFGHVRVHATAKAAESAQALNAHAYTSGSDVVFGEGSYAPSTLDGQKLLAHELVHVVQQTADRTPFAQTNFSDRHNSVRGTMIQPKLILNGKKRKDSEQIIEELEKKQGMTIEENGVKYLKAIIGSASTHTYKDLKELGTSLKMRDRMLKAAEDTGKTFGFDSSCSIASSKWKMTDGTAVAQTDNHAEALEDLFGTPGSKFECKDLSHLILLRALYLTVDQKEFNRLLDAKLGGEKLTIPINGNLMDFEDLGEILPINEEEEVDENADLYLYPEIPLRKGESYKPGDWVLFSLDDYQIDKIPEGDKRENITKVYKTIWQVENAVCVGYKGDEPIFAGGGISGAHTEKEMKLKLLKCMERDLHLTLTPYEDYLIYITLSRITEKLNVFGQRTPPPE